MMFVGDFGYEEEVFEEMDVPINDRFNIEILFAYHEFIDGDVYILFKRSQEYYEVKFRYCSDEQCLDMFSYEQKWQPRQIQINNLCKILNTEYEYWESGYSDLLKNELLKYLKEKFKYEMGTV